MFLSKDSMISVKVSFGKETCINVSLSVLSLSRFPIMQNVCTVVLNDDKMLYYS